MIRIRIDDFPFTRPEERATGRHSLQAFREFHRRLSECIGGKRYLLGVIPGKCDPDDLMMLRNETDCIIGMHGTDHDESRLDRNGGNQFEPWWTRAGIQRVLNENREALQAAVGRPVTVYMPPRNVIDWRTILALGSGTKFTRFTVGPETDPQIAKHPVAISSMPPDEYGRTDELWNIGAHERLAQRTDDVVLTLHWTWERNRALEFMSKFLTSIPLDRFADFDI